MLLVQGSLSLSSGIMVSGILSFSWCDTFGAGAHRFEDQHDGVAEHCGGLHRAVAGCRAWAWLGDHHGQRAIAQDEEGARVARSHVADRQDTRKTRQPTHQLPLFTTQQALAGSFSSRLAALT